MKLQIDTNKKTIKIEESINLFDLMNTLNQLFPNDSWKEYSLESATITNWINPVYIQPHTVVLGRNYYQPYEVYCGTGSNTNYVNTLSSSNTVHNIELN